MSTTLDTSGRADLALNLAILSIALPLVPVGPVAWSIASRGLRAGGGQETTEAIGRLETARIVGIAGSVLSALFFLALAATLLSLWGVWLGARAIF